MILLKETVMFHILSWIRSPLDAHVDNLIWLGPLRLHWPLNVCLVLLVRHSRYLWWIELRLLMLLLVHHITLGHLELLVYDYWLLLSESHLLSEADLVIQLWHVLLRMLLHVRVSRVESALILKLHNVSERRWMFLTKLFFFRNHILILIVHH